MKNYHVEIKEILIWTTEIEAQSEEEAKEFALAESNSDMKSDCVYYEIESVTERDADNDQP